MIKLVLLTLLTSNIWLSIQEYRFYVNQDFEGIGDGSMNAPFINLDVISVLNFTTIFYIISNDSQILINKTLNFTQNITIQSLGKNNGLLLKNAQLNFNHLSLEIIGFSIEFQNSYELYITFSFLNGSVFKVQDSFFLFNNDFNVNSIIEINDSALSFKNLQITNHFKPKLNYIFKSYYSDIILENVILTNNTLNNTVFLSALYSRVNLGNMSILNNSIDMNTSSFLLITDDEYNSPNENFLIIENLRIKDCNIETHFLNLNGTSNVVMIDSEFINTTFILMILISNTRNTTISNTSFINNIISAYPTLYNLSGSLHFEDNHYILLNLLDISKCYSDDEDSKTLGLYSSNVDLLLLTNCSFVQNVRNYEKRDNNPIISVVFYFETNTYDNSLIIINDCFFSQNVLIMNEDFILEGAPCGVALIPIGRLEFHNTIFENNLSTDFSICLDMSVHTIVIDHVLFHNNSAYSLEDIQKSTLSGALVMDFYNMTLINSNFTFNSANQGSCLLFKLESIFFNQNNLFDFQILTAIQLNFIGNYAYYSSNAIHIFPNEYNRLLLLKDCNFIKGRSDGFSGLFYFGTKTSQMIQNYTILGCHFIRNYGFNYGVVIEHYPPNPNNCYIYFESCTFLENQLLGEDISQLQGLVIDVWGEALENSKDMIYAIKSKNCFFSGHITYSATVFYGNRVNFYHEQLIFKNNTALYEGGGFLLVNSILTLKDSIIKNSNGLLAGGFLSLKERSSAIIFNNTVSHCFSNKGGFANIDMFSNISINSSKIQDCNASIGSLLFSSNGFISQINIIKSYFFNNSGIDSFIIYSENSNFTLRDSIFENSSEVMLLSNCFTKIKNVQFLGNLCFLNLKGCIGSFIDQTTVFISETTVSNVQGKNQGGVFYTSFSIINVYKSNFSVIKNEQIGAVLFSDNSQILINQSFCISFRNDALKIQNSYLTLINMTFSNKNYNFTLKSNVINCFNCFALLIVDCVFSNIISNQNGSSLYFSGTNKILKYEIYNTSFLNNSAFFAGGAIYHAYGIGLIMNSIFLYQNAQIGAGLTFLCPDYNQKTGFLALINNSFLNNYAYYEGGAIKWNLIKPKNLSTNIFQNNTAAIYGNTIANIPIRFGINIYDNNNVILLDYYKNSSVLEEGIILNNVSSGGALSYNIEFFLVDSNNILYRTLADYSMKVDLISKFDEIVNINNSFIQNQTNNLASNQTAYIFGTTNVQINKKFTFMFDKITLVGTPNFTVILRFSTASINFFYQDLLGNTRYNEISDPTISTHPYVYLIPIKVRLCLIGEIYNEEKNTCDQCPAGKYKFDNIGNECFDCFENAMCKGGFNIYVSPGFWRSNIFSSLVYLCDQSLEICMGGVGMECFPRYQGKMCEECDIDENGNPTKKNIFGECIPCEFAQKTIWLNILFIVVYVTVFAVICKIFLSNRIMSEKKVVLRIFMNYFLDLYFFPVRNNFLNKSNELYKWVNGNLIGFPANMFSYDCFYINFGFDNSKKPPSIFNRFAFFMLTCVAFMLVLYSFWKILEFILKRKMNSNFTLNLFVWLYIIFPFLTLKSLEPFNCLVIDNSSYVQTNLDIECWSYNHILGVSVLCIPNILFWMIILPFKIFSIDFEKNLNRSFRTVMYTFKRQETSNQDIKFKQEKENDVIKLYFPKFNIFYIGYKDSYFYWEKYSFMKKISLICLVGLFEREKIRLFFSLFVYFIYFFLINLKKPLSIERMNIFESFHSFVFFMSYLVLILANIGTDFDSNSLIISSVIILHFCFICTGIFLFLKGLVDEYEKSGKNREKLRKIKNVFKIAFNSVKNFFHLNASDFSSRSKGKSNDITTIIRELRTSKIFLEKSDKKNYKFHHKESNLF